MKHLNRMTARELETELSRLVHLRTDIDGNELAHCAHGSVRDYIVTFDPATVRGLLDVAIDAVSARLDAVSEAERKRDAA